jgi:hypothetical protein
MCIGPYHKYVAKRTWIETQISGCLRTCQAGQRRNPLSQAHDAEIPNLNTDVSIVPEPSLRIDRRVKVKTDSHAKTAKVNAKTVRAILSTGADPLTCHGIFPSSATGVRPKEGTALGFRRLPVRPQHPKSDPQAQAAFKKLSRSGSCADPGAGTGQAA